MAHPRGLATLAALAFAALLAAAILSPSARAAFDFKEVVMHFEAQDGAPAAQAGSHPFAWRTTVLFDADGAESGGLKDLQIRVPPGLVGTPRLLPECEHEVFILNACPDSTAVGVLSVLSEGGLGGGPAVPILVQAPVFNLKPLPGSVAELGAFPEAVNLALPLKIGVGISSAYPHQLIASLTKVSQVVPVLGYQLTLWGDPADSAHDPLRGACGAKYELGLESFEPLSTGSCPFAAGAGAPFLTLPSSCAAGDAGFEATPWSAPSSPISGSVPNALQPIGCAALGYSPELRADPTTAAASAPSGLDVTLDAPDEGIASSTGRANADTERAVLELPLGLTVNPPVAAGLAACSPDQLAAKAPGGAPGDGCPQASKLGRAEVQTPLFAKPIAGSLYAAEPDERATATPGAENPFDALFALYLVLRDPERGVLLDLPIRIEADPETGRLTASFDQIPELPLDHLELHFNSGPHAPLTTPAACGSHTIAYTLTPSSGNAPLSGADSFTTSANCDRRFAPTLAAGTANPVAGRSSPFALDLSQASGEENLSRFSLTLPPGLSADFAAVPLCPEALAAAGRCPPASKLGFVRIAAGSGSEPLWVPPGAQPSSAVYLAGPYRGAPFSLVVVVPAQAGPFDLGTVVTRAAISIDPETAQAGIRLDPLPRILDGVPIAYRTVRVVFDRPGFIRNPTSCEPMAITGSATASLGQTAALSERFQVGECAALRFRPKLAISLSGAIGRGGHPALRAVLRGDPGGAAPASMEFALPADELLDPRHIGALCSRSLAADRCPPRSRLGRLSFDTPLLDARLSGSVYLRAPGSRLPDLVADLRSGPLHFVLDGHTATAAGRLRVRFPSIPDIPLSKAVLSLAGGRRGIVVNSRALCSRPSTVGASFSAHNGKRRWLRVPIRLGSRC